MPKNRLAAFIVRRYPRAWRERYEQEMLAVLDEASIDWHLLFDLARTCISEHANRPVGPFGELRMLQLRWIGRFIAAYVLAICLAFLGWSLAGWSYAHGYVVDLDGGVSFGIQMLLLMRSFAAAAALTGRRWLALSRTEFLAWLVVAAGSAAAHRLSFLAVADLSWNQGRYTGPSLTDLVFMLSMPLMFLVTGTTTAMDRWKRMRSLRTRPNVPTKILGLE